MVWKPQQYLKFSGHRLRPAIDLLMRIPDFAVRSVADLGAGTGKVTKLLRERWPEANVVGVDDRWYAHDRSRDGRDALATHHVSIPSDRDLLGLTLWLPRVLGLH
jgi:trans-aconitate methyltransferase